MVTCSGASGDAVSNATVTVRSAQLSWTSDEFGLAGFRLYYGTTSRAYTQQQDYMDPSVTSVTLDLAPGTYYFAVTAIGADGAESGYSNEVSKTVM